MVLKKKQQPMLSFLVFFVEIASKLDMIWEDFQHFQNIAKSRQKVTLRYYHSCNLRFVKVKLRHKGAMIGPLI